MHVNRVQGRDVAKWFEYLLGRGLSASSIRRHRASLSSFFAWCVEEKFIQANPVTGTRVPSDPNPPTEMNPFAEDELEAAWAQWHDLSPTLADALLVLGWTGLRWGELLASAWGDFVEVPSPCLRVSRSQSEGAPRPKGTKSNQSRRVPLADRVLPIVSARARGRSVDSLLFVGTVGDSSGAAR